MLSKKATSQILSSFLLAVFLLSCERSQIEQIAKPNSIIDLSSLALEDQFVRVAEIFPGFAGLYYGDDGVLNLNVAPPSSFKTAALEPFQLSLDKRSSLLEILIASLGRDILMHGYSSMGLTDKFFSSESSIKDAVKVNIVTYDFPTLLHWYTSASELLSEQGVISGRLDEKLNRLVFEISDLTLRDEMEKRLNDLEVPIEAVIFEGSEMYEFTQGGLLITRQKQLRGGVEINASCTLGFNAIRGTVRGFVTASHCATPQGSVNSRPFYNVRLGNAQDKIGVELVDPPFVAGRPGCPSSDKCRYSDSAFIRYEGLIDRATPATPLGQIANVISNGSVTINSDYPNIAIARERSKTTVYAGLQAFVLGRTSGKLLGDVVSASTTISDPEDQAFSYVGQGKLDLEVFNGDSGGPVYMQRVVTYSCPNPPSGFPTCLRIETDLLGIVWGKSAGISNFSPIWQIEADLGALTTR